MEAVSPTLGHDVDDGPGVAAKFGIEIVGNDTKFLGRIRVGTQHAARNSRYGRVIVVHTVEQEVVVALAGSVDRKSAEAAIRLRRAGREQH